MRATSGWTGRLIAPSQRLMARVEDEAYVRVRGEGRGTDERQRSSSLLWTAFKHETSRPVRQEDGTWHTDPHRHAHVMVFNTTRSAHDAADPEGVAVMNDRFLTNEESIVKSGEVSGHLLHPFTTGSMLDSANLSCLYHRRSVSGDTMQLSARSARRPTAFALRPSSRRSASVNCNLCAPRRRRRIRFSACKYAIVFFCSRFAHPAKTIKRNWSSCVIGSAILTSI